MGGLFVSSVMMASGESEAQATRPVDAGYEVLQDRPDRLIAVLPNRMIVAVQELPAAPVVSAHVWVKTGSIYEQEHVGAGLSHFLEHLLSGGTTATRSEAESNAILGRIGAQTNAATSLDTVRYYINTTSEHTDAAVDLLTDWLRHNVVLQSEYEREQQVIQSEFAMGQGDPGRIHWKLTQQVRYPAQADHPARHPTIGYIDEFMTVSRDELEGFYRRMYVPNNMVAVVVGDVDRHEVVGQLAELWGDADTGQLPELTMPAELPLEAVRSAEAVADVQRPRLRLMWPGVRLGSEHDYALDLLAVILGQGETSRLVQQLRDEQGRVTSVDAYNWSTHWGEGYFGVDAEVAVPDMPPTVRMSAEAWRRDQLAQTRRAVLQQVQRIIDQPVSDGELERAKRRLLSRVLLSDQTAQGVAGRLARDIIASGDPDHTLRWVEAIQDLTAEDLQAAASAVLDPELYLEANLMPQPEGHTAEAQVRLDQQQRDPDVPTTAVDLDNAGLIERVRASLRDAEARDAIVVDDPTVHTLDNGLRVVIQRSTLVPGVAMQVYSLGGLLAEEPGREGEVFAMASMLDRGAGELDQQQLARRLAELGASLGAGSGNSTSYATATALSENWPEVLGLLADVVQRPALDAQQWQRLQPRLLAAIDRRDDRWSGELGGYFRQAYYDGHPWATPPTGRAQVVADLTVDDLQRRHAQSFDPTGTVLAVVGDVDPAQVVEQVQALFGDMAADRGEVLTEPGPDADGGWLPAQPEAPEARLVVHRTAKPVAAVQVGLGPGVVRDSPDYAGLQVLASVLSSFPSGRLEQALRGEGPGLAYAVHGYQFTGMAQGHMAVIWNTTPQSLEQATRRAMQVLQQVRDTPVSEQELARAKAAVLTREFFGQQSNAGRATGYALDLLYGVGEPAEADAAFRDAVQSLTTQDLQRLARQYLASPVVVVMSSEPVDEAALRHAVSDAGFDLSAATQPANR